MNILFIANLVPYPLDGGGKIKTFTTIQILSKKNTVDLLCFYEKENKEDALRFLKPYCRNIELIPIKVTTRENMTYIMKQALKCLLIGKSVSIHKYSNPEMKNAITEYMSVNTYDIAYFNLLHVYIYKQYIMRANPNLRCVLDTQNCETLIFKRRAKNNKNYFKKKYLSLEAERLKRFECWAAEDTDRLILLSEVDKREIENMVGHEIPATIIPVAVNEPSVTTEIRNIKTGEPINILFIGTLTWAPNDEGMIWFLKNILPLIEKNGLNYKLFIVGKNPSEQLKSLARKYKNIDITGYVASVDPYYQQCDFMIVPLFFGSGQRVKIIEGLSRGMPIISTSIGAEGLEYSNGENLIIADNEQQFIDALNVMTDYNTRVRLSKNGRKTYDQYYSPNAIKILINTVVESLQQ